MRTMKMSMMQIEGNNHDDQRVLKKLLLILMPLKKTFLYDEVFK